MSRFAVGSLSRRRFLQAASLFGVLPLSTAAWSDAFVELGLPGGPDQRSVTTAFPQNVGMILQRSRPPLLETPFDVFDRGVFTPNDQFFVRWHWALIPTEVDVAAFKLTLRGQVNQALSLSMADIGRCRAWKWRRSTNVPAIGEGCFSHACPAPSGRTAPWAMRSGPGFACATCSIAQG